MTGWRPLLGRPWLPPLLVALVALGAYLNTLRCGFTFDDEWLILDNPRIADGGYVRELLFERTLWRPVKRISLMADYALWGREHPGGFHLTSILLHAGVCLALHALLGRIGAGARVAFLGASVFALHPAFVESVANISHRKESLSLLFQLLGFLAYLRARSDPPPRSLASALLARLGHWEAWVRRAARAEWLLWCGLSYLLGLLSKEVGAVMLPVLIVLWELSQGGGSRRQRLRILGAAAVPLGAILCLFVFKGYLGDLLKRFEPAEIVWVTREQTSSYGALLLRSLKALSMAASTMLWPRTLYLDRAFASPRGVTDPAVLAGLFVVVAGAVALVVAYRRSRLAFFGLAWAAANWLPVSNLIPLTHWAFAERFLYVPGAGFALLVALGLDRLIEGRLGSYPARPVRVLGILATTALLLAYAARTVAQTEVWRSQDTLWRHTLRHNPDSYRGLSVLGFLRLKERELAEAEPLLVHCLEVNPRYKYCRQNLQTLLFMQGRGQEALDRALAYRQTDPRDALAAVLEGKARLALGDLAGARGSFEEALAIDPRQVDALLSLAQLALAEQRLEDALELTERARRKEPLPRVEMLRGQLLARLGRVDDAIRCYQGLVALDPRRSPALVPLARLLEQRGDLEGAIQVLERAVAGDPTRQPEARILELLRGKQP